MLARFLILVAMMLFGPLFIEVYLYHPLIALEHDPVAIVPLVASPLALFSGFLLLAADTKLTATVFAIVCTIAIVVGVTGTAIHTAMHAPTQLSLRPTPMGGWASRQFWCRSPLRREAVLASLLSQCRDAATSCDLL